MGICPHQRLIALGERGLASEPHLRAGLASTMAVFVAGMPTWASLRTRRVTHHARHVGSGESSGRYRRQLPSGAATGLAESVQMPISVMSVACEGVSNGS